MNKTNGFLPQGAYNLPVEVTSQQENKLLHVGLYTVTIMMKGMYRVLLSENYSEDAGPGPWELRF